MYNSSCSDTVVHKDSAWGIISQEHFLFCCLSVRVKDDPGALKEEAGLREP